MVYSLIINFLLGHKVHARSYCFNRLIGRKHFRVWEIYSSEYSPEYSPKYSTASCESLHGVLNGNIRPSRQDPYYTSLITGLSGDLRP